MKYEHKIVDHQKISRRKFICVLTGSTLGLLVPDGVSVYLPNPLEDNPTLKYRPEEAAIPLPFNGYFRELHARGIGKCFSGTRTYTLLKNGVETSLKCQAVGEQQEASYVNYDKLPVSFQIGDMISVQVITSGGSEKVAHAFSLNLEKG